MDPTNPQPVQPISQAPRPGWWSRNWKWFLPMGCLTFVALVVGFVGLLIVVVFGAMRSSDVYKEAVRRAKSNAEVAEALGAPLKEGWFLLGKTNVNGPSGEADISIPISGPNGSGTIYAVAEKSAGQWNYTTLQVEVSGTGKRIDLLGEEPEGE